MTHRLTRSLFDDDEPQALRLQTALARMEGGSPAQQKFQKLLTQVTRRRETLEQWQACDQRVQLRVAGELGPRLMRMRALQREILGQIDALLQAPRAGGARDRSHAARLRSWLRRLVDILDPEEEDRDLDALRVRHQCVSPRQRDARDRARLIEAIHGAFAPAPEELDRLKRASLEELLDDAERRTRQYFLQALPSGLAQALGRLDRDTARLEARRKAKRARAASVLQDEAAQAGQSLREVYRRLAMALHPDRERDPQRREHKTVLIQQVNHAYASGDLLTLLGFQIDTLETAAAGLDTLPEQKLEHFSQLLRQQLAQLDAEIEGLVARLGRAADVPSWQSPSPRQMDQAVSRDIAQSDLFIQDLEADLARLAASGTRVSGLASLPAEDSARGAEQRLEELLALIAASTGPKPGRRRR